MASGLAEPEPGPELTSPSAMSTQDVPREEEPTILAFPPLLVAEQLILMYTELFTRLTYSDCKAYFLNQPHMGGIEHLAPTIHKATRQFDRVVNMVTSSCLKARSMTAQDRARVVEFWIRVAKVCHWTAPRVRVLGPAPHLCQPQDGCLWSDPAWSLGPFCQGHADLDLQAPGVGQPYLAPSMG
ncbi:ral-GDS-related protein-like [Manis pentadactyla]|uniref:ral-GDS-related protein-like n=1 Tax=Manis pentadactyla TaxID=143292 RepID=UPI00255CF8EB|nr:ral-GDS-related protein-like [Manis pentadactyla]